MTETSSSIQIPESPGVGAYALFILATLWIIAITVLMHCVAWFTTQLLLASGITTPGYVWLIISWSHGVLLAGPVIPLAIFTRAPRLRAAYQTWLIAILFLFSLGLVRLLPDVWNQPAALAQTALSLVASISLILFARRRKRKLGFQSQTLLPALGIALLIILPWLALGALGSPLDSLLNLLAGLSLGLFAGVLIGIFLMELLAAEDPDPGEGFAFGGLAAGIALLILGSGFGFGGTQILLALVLPALGFAVAGLSRFAGMERTDANRSWLPIAALVGLATAAPLMFVDPEELSLLLGFLGWGDILQWALLSTGLSLFIAWAIGLMLWGFRHRLKGPPSTGLSLGGVIIAGLLGLLIYFFIGQPGFYGEQLFVILKDQADVQSAYTITNRDERLRYVYQTLTEHADMTQAKLRATLNRLHADYQPYYLVNAIEVNSGPILRAYLALQPEVDRILDSQHVRPLPVPPPVAITGHDPAPTAPPWNITSIGADRVWEEFQITGEGIVVGQSDSGVQGDHPALSASYRGQGGSDDYNWLDPWNHSRTPTDFGGHGTHTLGSILGSGGIGVAPGAQWFGCVNLARNLGNPAVYLDCLQFMLAPYPQDGDPLHAGDPARAAHVINNSWGCPPIEGCDANALGPAVSAMSAAGIFVVASAGNDGPRCGSVDDPPALYADAFSVGAVDEFGELALFSSRGPVTVDGSGRIKPDIIAPGVDVLSSLPENAYGAEEGTSMAGPHVVGAVALMWSANPKLIGDIKQTRQILIDTAQPFQGRQTLCSHGGTPNEDVGYGVLDAYAAVKRAVEMKR